MPPCIAPGLAPPSTPAAFAEYLERSARDDLQAYLLVRRRDGKLVGAASLTPIVHGPPQSAWLAFHGLVPHDGRGYMTDGVRAVLHHAFGALHVHRVEADVEHGNARSLALLANRAFYGACGPRFRCSTHHRRHRRGGRQAGLRFNVSGQHEGKFLGVAPTGRPFVLNGQTVVVFRDGQVVQRWTTGDLLGLLTQLGAIPRLPPDP